MITEVGAWILLGVGVVLLLCGGYSVVKGKAPRFPWIWIFGTLTAGTGVYGPAFMTPYREFLEVLAKMEGVEDPGEQEKLYERGVELANEMPAEVRKLAIPPLEEAIRKADSEHRPFFRELRTNRLRAVPGSP